MRISLRVCRVAAAAAAVVSGVVLAADTRPRLLDQAWAESMIEQCFARSDTNGWPPFSIAVVDAGGAVVLLRRQDGASSVTAEAAVLKARTAARFGGPTQELVALSQDSPTRDLMLLLQLTDDPGGIPIKVGGRVIGAIGVSGGAADQDVGCANVGVSVPTAEKK
jgi:glc operon protein GlcG